MLYEVITDVDLRLAIAADRAAVHTLGVENQGEMAAAVEHDCAAAI